MPPTREAAPFNDDAHSGRRASALLLIAGAALLAWFVVRTAMLGRISADVRAFQLAYLIGFAGFVCVLCGLWIGRGRCPGGWPIWLAVCFAVRLVPLAVEPSDDAYRYVWEGKMQRAGFNPYRWAPDDAALRSLRDDDWLRINHPDYPAIYPPLAQMEFLAVASIRPTIRAVKLVHVLWDALTVAVLAACLRRMAKPPAWALIYGLCPLVLTAFAIEGHVDSLMLLLIALTIWATLEGRWKLAAATLGLAISAKIVAIVLLPYLFLPRLRRATAFQQPHPTETPEPQASSVWHRFPTGVPPEPQASAPEPQASACAASRRRPTPGIVCALIPPVVLAATYLPYTTAGSRLFESLLRFPQAEVFFSFLPSLGVISPDATRLRILSAALLGAIVIGSAVLRRRRADFIGFAGDSIAALLLLMPVVHAWYLTWAILLTALRVRVSWVLASGAMVVYYEAVRVQAETGGWTMPAYAPRIVWGAWLIGAAIDAVTAYRRRGLAAAASGSPS